MPAASSDFEKRSMAVARSCSWRLCPVDVPRNIGRDLRVEPLRWVDVTEPRRAFGRRVEPVRLGERFDRFVLVAEEGAVPPDRVGVVVLIVDAVAEVERAFVVDLDEDDRSVRVHERRDDLPELAEVARGLVVENVARVARHRERDRKHRQDDRSTIRRARLTSRVPHDAFGNAEVGELGVDVWARSHDDVEALFLRHANEEGDIQARIAIAEVEDPRRCLVHTPRDIGVDEPETESALVASRHARQSAGSSRQ